MQREAEEEAKNQANMKDIELNAIREVATKMGLTIKEVIYNFYIHKLL